MQLSTPVKLPRPPFQIELGTPILALGSCFAERVGRHLSEALFPVTVNPTGIHYNPVSLSRCLSSFVDQPELFLHQGLWRSLQHHSVVSGPRPSETFNALRQAEAQRVQALGYSTILLLTLGTAQVWETATNGTIVSNCHRLDPGIFRRRRLSIEETVDALSSRLYRWLEECSARMVIVTVSPVRYLRDGLVENSRGKSVLLLACERLEHSHSRIVYFPSYELFLDEMRDYRFYEQDLVQPNATGVGLVWEAFVETFLSENSRQLLPTIQRVQKLAAHRLGPRSKPRELARKGLTLLEQVEKAAPAVASGELRARFQRWLA